MNQQITMCIGLCFGALVVFTCRKIKIQELFPYLIGFVTGTIFSIFILQFFF